MDRPSSWILALSLALFGAGPAVATDYFVRPDGNDSNAGTGNSAAAAWRTVGKCATTAQAGDRCLIQPGTYREKSITQANAGVVDGTAVATCTCTTGSTTIGCTAALPSSVTAGKYVQCQAGYGFSWSRVASVSGSGLTLSEPYRGKSASGSPLDVARFVEIAGTSAADVVISAWVPEPSGLTWTKEAGSTCVWSYAKSSTTNPAWSRAVPYGFRENNTAKWDLHRLNQNGADPYVLVGNSTSDVDGDGATGDEDCPCGEGRTLQQAVDSLPGSFSHDASKVYLNPRRRCAGGTADGYACLSNADCPGGGTCGSCPDPNPLALEASDSKPGVDVLLRSEKQYSVISNLTLESGNRHGTGPSKDITQAAILGASQALYAGIRANNGVIAFRPVNSSGGPSVDTRYEAIRALDSSQCLIAAGAYSGLAFYNVEIRGNYGNLLSCDEMLGASTEDRVVLDRMYFHRNFTDYIGDANGGGTCNGNAATWDCSGGYWSPTYIQYRGNHAMYNGSTTASKNMDHIVLSNSITELDTDGMSFFHGNNSKDIWYLNNTFGTTEHPHRLQAKFGNMSTGNTGGIKAYNNLFISTYPEALSEGPLNRESGVAPGNVASDYNLFLDAKVDANGGSSAPASMRVWESGETLSYVINSFNQERNSIQVCGQGCQGAAPGTHFDAGGSFRLKDVTVTDGTPTDYTPLTTFWGINKGTNTYCPSQDFLGRPRTDGQCDIGAIEYGSAPPDTTPPAAVTNFTAIGVDQQVALSWTHSSSSDNKGTMVRFST
ncbi:MAG: hypothetical protein MUC67_04145, partial [Acidobacteria bacterium]|nr:hypothetical protein [Acidobacteriota bacterium]